MTEHVRGPESVKPGLEDEHTRIADKRRFTGDPEVADGSPEEDLEGSGVEKDLDQDPARESLNRRDVPDTPENSIEARTEGE